MQPYSVFDPVRKAQPYGPLRPPAASEPASPGGTRYAPPDSTGATRELMQLTPGSSSAGELALAGRGRSAH
eukprot:8045660-Alexandrium_andersonii.AAC.1